MSRLESVTSALAAVVVIPVVLFVMIVVNGGYVWRADCVTSRGTVESSYSYRLYQIIPYLAPSEPGCSYYSGSRVLASAIGFWKIPDANASSPGSSPTSSLENARFVAGASDVLKAISAEWQRQVGLQDEIQGASRSEAITALRRTADRTDALYGDQIEQLNRLPEPADNDLAVLRTSLADWLGLQLSVQEVLVNALETGATEEQLEEQTAEFVDDLRSRHTTLLRMRAVLPSRYPELDNWDFLDRAGG